MELFSAAENWMSDMDDSSATPQTYADRLKQLKVRDQMLLLRKRGEEKEKRGEGRVVEGEREAQEKKRSKFIH